MRITAPRPEPDAISFEVTSSAAPEFERVIAEHGPDLFRYFVRRVDQTEVIGATADALLAVRARMSEMPDGDVRPWMFSIARDVLRSVATSRPRCPQCGWAPLDHHADGRAIDGDPFEALDEDDRELLRLRAWEGLTTPQLAAATGLSVRAVAVRLDAVGERISHAQLPAEPRNDEMWMPDPGDER